MVFVVLVTGGASGLGLATVKRLVKSGKKVVICDLEKSKGAEISKELGSNAVFVPCDITSNDDITKAIKITKETFGRLDVCINCAGVFLAEPVYNKETKTCDTLNTIRRVYEVNVFGTYNVICQATTLMAENEPDSDGQRGIFINVSSAFGYESPKGSSMYASSKAAIAGMTLPLARELGELGIRVMVIAPGAIVTPMSSFLTEKQQKQVLEIAAFPKRLGNPEEFAHTCEYIIENRFVNATVIRLDAGQRFTADCLLE